MEVMNLLVILFAWAYTITNVFIVSKELISDIKTPYLGISSSYIFIYFIACLVNLLQFCFIQRGTSIVATNHNIYLFYICNIIASYYCTIFLIKKFTFSSIKQESKITLILGFFLYVSLAIVIILRGGFEKSTPIVGSGYIVDNYYNLIIGISTEYYKSRIVLISRVIPILILFSMWFYSVTKPYNKKELNFFPKSANKPIILFMMYELLITLLPNIRVSNVVDKTIAIVLLLTIRLCFQISILHWLRHKDMEKIETSMIARSKREISLGRNKKK